jgi:hypothetical protein
LQKQQNTTRFSDGAVRKPSSTVATATRTARVGGKPQAPVEMAGKAMVVSRRATASPRLLA